MQIESKRKPDGTQPVQDAKPEQILQAPAIEAERLAPAAPRVAVPVAIRATDRVVELIRTTRLGEDAVAKLLAAVGIYLTIDRLDPILIVENRPTRVYFTLWNNTAAPTTGAVRGLIQPAKSIAGYDADFEFEVKNLAPHQTTCGVLTFKAPRCDRSNVVTLTYWTPGQVVKGVEFPADVLQGQNSMQFDVAARYSLTADKVTIWDTASFHNDTLYMVVNGVYGDMTSAEKQFLGDHNNGTFAVPFAGIGPFDSIPDVSKDVAIAWNLINQGHGAPVDKILDAFSDIGAAVATAIAGPVYAPISVAVDALHHLIIDYLGQDCDCIVDMGSQKFTSKQLYDETFDPNDQKSETMDWKRDHEQYGPCRTSDYNVRWHLTRYRKPWEVAAMKPDHISLAYGQQASFLPTIAGQGQNVVWEWDIVDGEGKVNNTGLFQVPASKGLCPYAVIHATGLVDGAPVYTGYAVVLFM